MKNDKIQLSISLLVSNTIDTIKKCMDSLVPILEAIPSELIVVDTGGADGSIEIAKQYTEHIVDFPWCNDFAKARNAGLEKAKGEWFMFLDDDEWFEDPGEIIEFFQSGEYKNYNCASYIIRNYTNKSGTRWNDTRYSRMAKLEAGTKFISPIHEILEPTYTPEKYFDCYVHHYGYAFDTVEEKRQHAKRNITLLEKVLEENKSDHRLNVQLAQEYGFTEEYEKSIEISMENIQLIDKMMLKSENMISYAGWHMNNVCNLKIFSNSKKESYKLAQQYFEKKWINIVTKNNLTNLLVRAAFDLKKYEECLNYIKDYLETYDIIQKNQEVKLRQTVTDQSRSYGEENYYLALLGAFKSANKLKREKKKKEYLERMSNTTFFLTTPEDYVELVNALWKEPSEEVRSTWLQRFLKSETFRKFMVGVIEDKSLSVPREELVEFLSNSGEEYSEFFYYKMIAANKREEEVKPFLDEYFTKEKNVLFMNIDILDIFREKVDMMEYVNQLTLEEWLQKINVFVERAPWDTLQKLREVCKVYLGYEARLSNLKIRCYEKVLRNEKLKETEFSYIDSLLKDYLDVILNFNSLIYREEIFSSELEFYLPDNCRFCNKIQAIYGEGLDQLAKAKIIRKAVDIYPPLASFCNIYIKKMQEESNKVTDEFLQLGEMIKQSIRKYIVLGQFDNAKMTLEQLERLIPNDPELLELRQMLI